MLFETELERREIKRGEDTDYFIDIQNVPVSLEIDELGISRIQYPISRAILVRTSPKSRWITVHILKDVDLYSAYSNFEIDIDKMKLTITKSQDKVIINIKKDEIYD